MLRLKNAARLGFLPFVTVLVGYAGTAHGQVTLSLKPFQPKTDGSVVTGQSEAPQEPPRIFTSLPAPSATSTTTIQSSDVTTASSQIPSQATPSDPGVQSNAVKLQPMPQISIKTMPKQNTAQSQAASQASQSFLPQQAITPQRIMAPQNARPETSLQVTAMRPTGFVQGSTGKPGELSVATMIGPPRDNSDLFRELGTDRHFFDGSEVAPAERSPLGVMDPYPWNGFSYCWQSPAFCYSPLYFEQPNFERYGQGKGSPFASTVSGAKFFGQVATLPVQMMFTPPWSNQCTLGNQRPGDCAPMQRKPEHQ
jgi:hypothetical protein